MRGDRGCVEVLSFALGQEVPQLPPSLRSGVGVTLDSVQAALKAQGSALVLHPCGVRHFDQLVREHTGMFVGVGMIRTRSMKQRQLHFFSYDADRKVLHDRPDELCLFEPHELTQDGSRSLFYRRFAKNGSCNLGWCDIREVRQVMVRTPLSVGPCPGVNHECKTN